MKMQSKTRGNFGDAIINMNSLLKTTLNTRDLGGHKTVDGKETIRDRIYRSDRQEYPNEEDINMLLSKHITSIIDMRSEQTVVEKKSGFKDREGFYYFNFPIIEGSRIPESVEAVPGCYMNIACSENMLKVFETMADAPEGVMFNCSAGKDRTGVVAAILLMMCGVEEKEIVDDYMLTKENSKERFDLVRKNFPDVDMNIVIPRESYIKDFMNAFKERFGNTEGYFSFIGLPKDKADKLYNKLMKKQL